MTTIKSNYNYSNVNMTNNNNNVNLTCKCGKHFPQASTSGVTKLTTQDFIQKAQSVHGSKFDYSNVNYVNSKTKINITCKSCDSTFNTSPVAHINGNSCAKCSGLVKHTTQTFVQKAQSVHGNKFDYSNVNYSNMNTKVQINCTCGKSFSQMPKSHIQGMGCPSCK